MNIGFELFNFLQKLQEVKINFKLVKITDVYALVIVEVPGEYWKVNFQEGKDIILERFRSDGKIYTDEELLEEVFKRYIE